MDYKAYMGASIIAARNLAEAIGRQSDARDLNSITPMFLTAVQTDPNRYVRMNSFETPFLQPLDTRREKERRFVRHLNVAFTLAQMNLYKKTGSDMDMQTAGDMVQGVLKRHNS